MRGQIDSKSNTCTEGAVVDAAGISGKVGVHYPGRSVGNARSRDRVEIVWHRRETRRQTEKTNLDLSSCRRQGCIERCGLSRQKSAAGIVGGIGPTEGPNLSFRTGSLRFDGDGETA
jgi:hypothetical protein